MDRIANKKIHFVSTSEQETMEMINCNYSLKLDEIIQSKNVFSSSFASW